MFVTWGPIGETGKWRAKAGTVQQDFGDSAAAHRGALRLAGHRKDRLRRVRFPAPAAPKTKAAPKAKRKKAKAPKAAE